MSRKVETIKATKNAFNEIRFAAYCRVSTTKDSQQESFEAQIKHYKDYFKLHPEYKLVGIYNDKGITATKKEVRPGLMQLIMDCKAGKIDMVITKSISRLSRNTTDCIEIVRTLLDADVGIIFEKENLNTKSMEGELMLSIMSSMAQDESESTSKNVKWGVKQRFMNGTYKLSCAPYGYKLNDGALVVDPKEAEAVRLIFSKSLENKGMTTIANEMNKTEYKPRRAKKWNRGSIFGIIGNVAYTGDMLFQKTITDSTFTKRMNKGEENQYYIENHHEPIIDHDTFKKANEMKRQRAVKFNIKPEEATNRYCFTQHIICGECGGNFIRSREWRRRQNCYIYVWTCLKHRNDKDSCSMTSLREMDIEHAFLLMMCKLVQFRNVIIRPLYDLVKDQESIATNVTFIKGKISRELDEYRKSFDKNQVSYEQKLAIDDLWSFAAKHKKPKEFKPTMFERFVDHIVVNSKHELVFHLKCGLKLKEIIE